MYGRGGGYGGGPFGGGGLAITPMVRNIILANVAVYIVTLQSPGLIDLLSVDGKTFHPWQFVSYMWLHSQDNLLHIVFNMLGLFMFGCDLERVWGGDRFLRFYIVCGVGAGFIIWLADQITGPHSTLGASGAVYGVMTAYSLQWPNRTFQLLFFPVPIRALYLIPVLFLMQLTLQSGENVSHVGHLGGVAVALAALRNNLKGQFRMRSLRYQWNRFLMRNRLRSVRRERDQWPRRDNPRDDDDHPTIH